MGSTSHKGPYVFQSSSGHHDDGRWAYLVSILIRPEGRMQRGSGNRRAPPTGFNPHPAFWPDATLSGDGPGETAASVSILIRPEGRMQLPEHLCSPPDRDLFQSSSGLLAGCNSLYPRLLLCEPWFQSSSGLLAGCNCMLVVSRRPSGCMFQSSSGQKAGCNGQSRCG